MKRLALGAFLMLAIALSGCTGGGGNGGDGGDSFVTPEQDDQDRYVIRMSNFEFDPPHAEVPAGSTVVWVNEEGSHNVAPVGHSQWTATSVSSATGEHLEVTMDETGTFPYVCQPHQSLGMEGTIRVV